MICQDASSPNVGPHAKLAQFAKWTLQVIKPRIGKIYTENQIYQIKDFLQITYGINLSKSFDGKMFVLKCKNFGICPYSLIFEKKAKRKKYLSKEYSFKLTKFCKIHTEDIQMNNCKITLDQIALLKMKKYLNLIKPTIQRIIFQSSISERVKNPTWILQKLRVELNQKQDFLFSELCKNGKRQLKKKFDNIIRDIKNDSEPRQNQANASKADARKKNQEKTTKSDKKTKQIKKIKKIKNIKKRSKKQSRICSLSSAKGIEQQVDLVKLQPKWEAPQLEDQDVKIQHFEMENDNLFDYCIHENIQHSANERQKQRNQSPIVYVTPKKKKENWNFDLQNSSSKLPTSLNASKRHQELKNYEKFKFNQHSQELNQQNNSRNIFSFKSHTKRRPELCQGEDCQRKGKMFNSFDNQQLPSPKISPQNLYQ